MRAFVKKRKKNFVATAYEFCADFWSFGPPACDGELFVFTTLFTTWIYRYVLKYARYKGIFFPVQLWLATNFWSVKKMLKWMIYNWILGSFWNFFPSFFCFYETDFYDLNLKNLIFQCVETIFLWKKCWDLNKI